MRPIKLTIDGINSFKTRQVLDFGRLSSDLFCVYGDTGAGKSTILDAMILALFGECGRGGDARGADFVNLERERAEVEFEFAMEGKHYRIWRDFAADARADLGAEEGLNGSGSLADGGSNDGRGLADFVDEAADGADGGGTDSREGGSEVASGGTNGKANIEALRGIADGEKAVALADGVRAKTKKSKRAGEPKKRVKLFVDGVLAATQTTEALRIIEDVVGLDRQDFTQVVVLEQGKFDRFLSCTRGERSATVAKLFRLDRFKDLYLKTDRALTAVRAKKENIEYSVMAFSAATGEALTALEGELAALDRQISEIDVGLEEASALAKRLAALKLEFEGAQRALLRKNVLIPELTALSVRLSELENAAAEAEKTCLEKRPKRELIALDLDRLVNLLPRVSELRACEEELVPARRQYADLDRERLSLLERAGEVKSQLSLCKAALESVRPQLVGYFGEGLLSAKTAAAGVSKEFLRLSAEGAALRTEIAACEDEQKKHYAMLLRYQTDLVGFKTESEKLAEILNIKEENYNKILAENAAQFVAFGLKDGDACPVCGGTFLGHSVHFEKGGSFADSGVSDGLVDSDFSATKESVEGGISNGLVDGELSSNGLLLAKEDLDRARAAAKKAESDVANLGTIIELQLSKIESGEKKRGELLARYSRIEDEQKTLCIKSEQERLNLIKLAESGQALAEKQEKLAAENEKNDSSLALMGQNLVEVKAKGTALKQRHDRIAAELAEKGGEDIEKRREQLAAELESLDKFLADYEKKRKETAEQIAEIRQAQAEKNKELSLLEPLIKKVEFDSELFVKTDTLQRELLRQKSEVSERRGGLLQRISACREGIEKRREADVQLKDLSKKEDRLDTLKKMLRGDRFLEFVADEYICQFAASASRILGGISGGKYALSYEQGEGKFYVNDYLSGGKKRKASTLSGGEMFLASLSLASAVARHIALKSYDFFFLDEGFGTLDTKRMDMVADALVGLSRSGMVGVISHRRELMERIPARVRVSSATAGEGSEIVVE